MRLRRILEAVLFAADGPQSVEQISLAVPERSIEELQSELERLRDAYEEEGRGWRLEKIAGGWRLSSHPDVYVHVERFLEGRRKARLSRAALEALAVVAYRQPITRGELEDLRGVDCGGVLHTLLDRDLVTVRGRSNAIGRPLIYGTTERFLEHFGLTSLSSLPELEEIESLWGSAEVRSELEVELERRMARYGHLSEMVDRSEGAPGGNGGSGEDEREGEATAETTVPEPAPEVVGDPPAQG